MRQVSRSLTSPSRGYMANPAGLVLGFQPPGRPPVRVNYPADIIRPDTIVRLHITPDFERLNNPRQATAVRVAWLQ